MQTFLAGGLLLGLFAVVSSILTIGMKEKIGNFVSEHADKDLTVEIDPKLVGFTSGKILQLKNADERLIFEVQLTTSDTIDRPAEYPEVMKKINNKHILSFEAAATIGGVNGDTKVIIRLPDVKKAAYGRTALTDERNTPTTKYRTMMEPIILSLEKTLKDSLDAATR